MLHKYYKARKWRTKYILWIVFTGTPGYIAPESILYHSYSGKTDLWQAGCTLYSLLSGLLPYNRDDYEQVTHHKWEFSSYMCILIILCCSPLLTYCFISQCRYYPMKGVGWDNISAEAKDLVRQILIRRPESRIDAEVSMKTKILCIYFSADAYFSCLCCTPFRASSSTPGLYLRLPMFRWATITSHVSSSLLCARSWNAFS